MQIQLKDLIDVYVAGLLFEIKREFQMEFGNLYISNVMIGEKVETNVLKDMEHECKKLNSHLLNYVNMNTSMTKWYETDLNRYSDYFLEAMPISEPYINDPEKYANIWGNLTIQLIGAVVGNIREDGL